MFNHCKTLDAMKKTRVLFRTGKKLGHTLAIFPDTLEGDEILA